jgi:hypothetical protein
MKWVASQVISDQEQPSQANRKANKTRHGRAFSPPCAHRSPTQKIIRMNHTNLALLFAFSLSTAWAQEPDRLRSLRDSYRSAVERSTTPLTKTYLAELEKLKTDLTKKGDLQGALAVDAEIKAMEPSAATPTSKSVEPSKDGRHVTASSKKLIEERFVGKMWTETNGTGPGRPFFFFRKDGTVTRKTVSAGLSHGTWRMNDDGVVEIRGIGGGITWMSFDSETAGVWIVGRGEGGKRLAIELVPGQADPGAK